MPYKYVDGIAIADVAFEAWGETIEEMITSAADATINVMVDSLDSISPALTRSFHVEDEALDLLLFSVLQELLYYKDAERLLLRVRGIEVWQGGNLWSADVDASGDSIDARMDDLVTDVKAVTLHRLHVEQTNGGWKALVVLDV